MNDDPFDSWWNEERGREIGDVPDEEGVDDLEDNDE